VKSRASVPGEADSKKSQLSHRYAVKWTVLCALDPFHLFRSSPLRSTTGERMRPPVVKPGPPVEALDLGSLLFRQPTPRGAAAFTPRRRPATARPSTAAHSRHNGEAMDAIQPAERRPLTARTTTAAITTRIEAARRQRSLSAFEQLSSVNTSASAQSQEIQASAPPERAGRAKARKALEAVQRDPPPLACAVEFVCQPDPRWENLYAQVIRVTPRNCLLVFWRTVSLCMICQWVVMRMCFAGQARRELKQDARVEREYVEAMYSYGGKQVKCPHWEESFRTSLWHCLLTALCIIQVSCARIDLNLRQIAGYEEHVR
jgi:hypothetical protein